MKVNFGIESTKKYFVFTRLKNKMLFFGIESTKKYFVFMRLKNKMLLVYKKRNFGIESTKKYFVFMKLRMPKFTCQNSLACYKLLLLNLQKSTLYS